MPSRSRSAASSIELSDWSGEESSMSMNDRGGIASGSSSNTRSGRRDDADQTTLRVASTSLPQSRPSTPEARMNPKSVTFNDTEDVDMEEEDEDTLVSSEDGERKAMLSNKDNARRKSRDSEMDELEDLERELGLPDGGKESRASRRRQHQPNASSRLAYLCPSFFALVWQRRSRHPQSPRWTLSPKSAPRVGKLIVILASILFALAASGAFLTKSDVSVFDRCEVLR